MAPFLGALAQGFFPSPQSRWLAFFSSLVSSCLGIGLVTQLVSHSDEPSVSYPWIHSYDIFYHLGLDGLNALLVLLISLIFPILIATEWKRAFGLRGLHALFLILQTCLLGCLFAQDLFLQFFFLGITSFPLYFLIGIWGGKNREMAAFQFFITSLLGFLVCMIALIFIYYAVEPHGFSLKNWKPESLLDKNIQLGGGSLSVSSLTFFFMIFGLLVLKAPVWPLHTWFYTFIHEAPASVSIALGSALLPVVLFIFMKTSFLLFPEKIALYQPWLMGVGLVNLLMGSLGALAQRQLTGVLAFTGLSQVGWVLIGMASAREIGVVGAFYQLFVAGLSFASLGLVEGMLRERTQDSAFLDEKRQKKWGGLVHSIPLLACFAGTALLANLGLPGMGSFISQAFILMGSFEWQPLLLPLIALFFLFLATCFFTLYPQLFLGEPKNSPPSLQDATFREKASFIPILLALIFLGCYPKPWLEILRPAVLKLLAESPKP